MSSYCGLIYTKIRSSDKDLLVSDTFIATRFGQYNQSNNLFLTLITHLAYITLDLKNNLIPLWCAAFRRAVFTATKVDLTLQQLLSLNYVLMQISCKNSLTKKIFCCLQESMTLKVSMLYFYYYYCMGSTFFHIYKSIG